MGKPLTGKTVRRSERTAAAANAAKATGAAEGSVGSAPRPLGRMPVVRQHPAPRDTDTTGTKPSKISPAPAPTHTHCQWRTPAGC
jgi:hypothetical protein